MPKNERYNALQTFGIYVPEGARMCAEHYNNYSWDEAAPMAVIHEYNARQVEEMVGLLRSGANNNFISDAEIKCNTGLNKRDFENLFSHVPSLIAAFSNEHDARNALIMFLMRFRKAATYEYIGDVFGVSRHKVTDHIEKARIELENNFVPKYLGFDNLSRDFLLKETTKSSRILHADNKRETLMTIWDGTYIYCDKSANYEFQKKTFSGQKNRNFVRPMVCVTTNGYIIDILGPFEAVKNDAKCMLEIMQRNQYVNGILRQGDVFILDRGFRDCKQELNEMGYIVKMPEFVKKNEPNQQLSTDQANKSRLVTKTRYVVEARNGNIKTIWPIFARPWSTLSLIHVGRDLRIAAALINKYFNEIVADKGEQEEVVAEGMLARVNLPNILQPIVCTQLFQGHLEFLQPIDDNDFRFPRMDEVELAKITFGPYQIKQAKSYACAHKKRRANEDSHQYLCFSCPEDITRFFFADIIREKDVLKPVLMLTRMDSRFRSRKKYDVYILADAEKNGPEGIVAYCCECRHGLRTVGCCSHIATNIFYMSFARHNGGIRPVAGHVDGFFNHAVSDDSSSED